jgi:hypothetical protein
MKHAAIGISLVLLIGCGVPKEFVRQETKTAFNNAAMIARRVKDKCGEQTEEDASCRDAKDKLLALCERLDELAAKAEGQRFDCVNWKAKP